MNEGVDDMINENVLQVLGELISDTGDTAADVLSNVECLEEMIEVAGDEYEDLTDAGIKKFALEVFDAYVAEEMKYLKKNIEFMFDDE